MHRWPEPETHDAFLAKEPVRDMDGVLEMRHEYAFFQDATANVVTPDRQSRLEAKFAEKFGRVEVQMFFRQFLAAEVDDRLIR